MLNVAIIGAAGLAGLELIHWLNQHPHVNLKVITSGKHAGQALGHAFPQYAHMEHTFSSHEASVEECDVAFLAIPNSASLEFVPRLIDKGIRVIDLSGVYRIHDTQVFERYYQLYHTSQDLLKTAVFGLPEFYKEQIKEASLIANPGCYATGSLLGLLPFGEDLRLLEHAPIIDAKSGVTGAGGRVETDITGYVNVNENFKAYKVFQHQHQPEIQQYVEMLTPYRAAEHGSMIFTPHLLPLNRGILSSIYLQFKEPVNPKSVREKYESWAADTAFVHVLPEGELPDLRIVQNSNRCMIGLSCDESHKNWAIITTIDNLVKGASGQAIQNMNLMFGFNESEGLH